MVPPDLGAAERRVKVLQPDHQVRVVVRISRVLHLAQTLPHEREQRLEQLLDLRDSLRQVSAGSGWPQIPKGPVSMPLASIALTTISRSGADSPRKSRPSARAAK